MRWKWKTGKRLTVNERKREEKKMRDDSEMGRLDDVSMTTNEHKAICQSSTVLFLTL